MDPGDREDLLASTPLRSRILIWMENKSRMKEEKWGETQKEREVDGEANPERIA